MVYLPTSAGRDRNKDGEIKKWNLDISINRISKDKIVFIQLEFRDVYKIGITTKSFTKWRYWVRIINDYD